MPEQANGTFGDAIRKARTDKKKGLRELARDLDITPSYLSDIENDRRIPAEDVIAKIAAALGVDFEALMALAGRVGAETERYLRKTPAAGTLFRQVSHANLSPEDLRRLSKMIETMDNKKEE